MNEGNVASTHKEITPGRARAEKEKGESSGAIYQAVDREPWKGKSVL